ncbi:MAG: SDR family oxidoreductase [Eubacteriaceae bacterium]|nr:SDR family oxidoreductase [Eubacteriaceae bacterium]
MSIYASKTAIVTGAGSGIGRALVLALVKKGALVAGADINYETMQETVKMAQEIAPGCIVEGYEVDVSNSEAVKTLVFGIYEKWGQLDYMFNVAAVAYIKDERFIDIPMWDKLISINLMGAVYGSHYAYEVMREKGSGYIVNMSSLSGITPSLWGTNYSASKFGINGYTLSLRVEAERFGIRATAVCMSMIKTPMLERAGEDEIEQELYKRSIGRLPAITADGLAEKVLKRLPRNRPIMVIDVFTRLLWWAFRISDSFYEKLLKYAYKKHYLSEKEKIEAEQAL